MGRGTISSEGAVRLNWTGGHKHLKLTGAVAQRLRCCKRRAILQVDLFFHPKIRVEDFEAKTMPHFPDLYRTARLLAGGSTEAEDLVGYDVYLEAWKSFHRFQRGTNCRAWLFKILFHRLHHCTNATDIYSSTYTWFGIPAGAASGTQDNPTGIASMDGTNYWGTGNFAGVSGELDGTMFYNPGINLGHPVEVQNYIQAAGEARIIGGTLYVATKAAAGVASGIYNFVDQYGNVVPLPWDPNVPNPYYNYASTNLFINWGNTFQTILNFDMNPSATVAYGADQTYGIVKFTNNAGTWVQAPYYFTTTNLGTTAQTPGNQGCFGICVDFSGANPVIYATTMENGTPTSYVGGFGVNTKQGHQNNNRLIKIVDTGVNPGTNYVATTLAIASTTNEFFGGIDFTPTCDL